MLKLRSLLWFVVDYIFKRLSSALSDATILFSKHSEEADLADESILRGCFQTLGLVILFDKRDTGLQKESVCKRNNLQYLLYTGVRQCS